MRVTVLELAATWGEPRWVLDHVEAALHAGSSTDLVLPPEASLTGVRRTGARLRSLAVRAHLRR